MPTHARGTGGLECRAMSRLLALLLALPALSACSTLLGGRASEAPTPGLQSYQPLTLFRGASVMTAAGPTLERADTSASGYSPLRSAKR